MCVFAINTHVEVSALMGATGILMGAAVVSVLSEVLEALTIICVVIVGHKMEVRVHNFV